MNPIELRINAGLTITEAAKMLNITVRTLRQIERGGRINLKIAIKMCQVYGISLKDIYSEVNNGED